MTWLKVLEQKTRLSPNKKNTAFSTFNTSKTVSYSIFSNLFFSKKSYFPGFLALPASVDKMILHEKHDTL